MDIKDNLELVIRYNAELEEGEYPMTFQEMAAIMGYERVD